MQKIIKKTTTGLAVRKILQRRQDELKPNHIQRKLVTKDDSQSSKIHYFREGVETSRVLRESTSIVYSFNC